MFKKAFTMAELIIVMIITGLLTTVLIQNIRSPKIKEKEMIANAFKAIEAVEQATAKIREVDKTNCPMGTFIVKHFGKGSYSYELKNDAGTSNATATDVMNMMQRYIRFEGTIGNFCDNTPYCSDSNIKGAKFAGTKTFIGFKVYSSLDNCPTYRMPNDATTYPAPTKFNKATASHETKKCWGELYIDTNGIDTPNTYGQDVFIYGLDESGIAK